MNKSKSIWKGYRECHEQEETLQKWEFVEFIKTGNILYNIPRVISQIERKTSVNTLPLGLSVHIFSNQKSCNASKVLFRLPFECL